MSNIPDSAQEGEFRETPKGAAPCPPDPCTASREKAARMMVTRMTTGVYMFWKPVLLTIVCMVALIIVLLGTVGFRTEVQDPTRIDAGLWRRMSFNNDNQRRIETKNRLGNVEAYKHTRAGSYKLSYDENGGIWVPTGPRK